MAAPKITRPIRMDLVVNSEAVGVVPIKSSRGVAILTATQSATLRVVAEAAMPAFHFRRPRWPSRLLTADALRRFNNKAPGRRCINIIRNWNAPCCSKPETAPMGKLHKGNKFRLFECYHRASHGHQMLARQPSWTSAPSPPIGHLISAGFALT